MIYHSELQDMGKFTYSVVAKGVSRERLFEWYTDYSSEDADILKRRAGGQLLSRKCTRDGNKLHVESELRGMRGKSMKAIADAILHPEDYTYDIRTSMPGMFVDDRHYTFTQLPEGTKLSIESQYRATGRLMKFLSAIGILRILVSLGPSKTITKAFIAEAEEQLGNKTGK